MKFITRFAPSPTGLLHLGHAFSALHTYEAAKAAGGQFILRLEDIDQTRSRPAFEEAIYDDLAWLGLKWETPVRRQSGHFADYTTALDKLRKYGLVYRCFKTRREVAEEITRAPHLCVNGPEGPTYQGTALTQTEENQRIADGQAYAWRLSMRAAQEHLGPAWKSLSFEEEGAGPNGETGRIKATPEIFGDVIIARKDAGTSYHMAVVHDDALQNISHIIRGNDLFHASHLHVLLQRLLDVPTPIYRHHHLITDETGKRYAKRDKSMTLHALRESGTTLRNIKDRISL